MTRFKKLSPAQQLDIEREVKLMLHASRDCLRNQDKDTLHLRFDVTDGYYGEAFGIMRGLYVLGYGEFGSVCDPHSEHAWWNLRWWFVRLEQTVLDEEHFTTDNCCESCFAKYGKDDARRDGWSK